MSDNSFNEVVNSMMQGMESFLSSKTVVGQPTQAGDTTIIPLVDVTFGVGGCIIPGEEKWWCRRHDGKDVAKCRAGYQKRTGTACQYQEPGYSQQNYRYGSGFD